MTNSSACSFSCDGHAVRFEAVQIGDYTMVSQTKYRQLPAVDEQTVLDDPIKIGWYGDSKSRKHFRTEELEPRLKTRDSEYPAYGMMGVSLRAFDRQKSNVIFKTAEEALETYRLLYRYFDSEAYEWADRRTSDAFKRRRREIQDALEQRGFVFQMPVGGWVEHLVTPDGDRLDLTGENLKIEIRK